MTVSNPQTGEPKKSSVRMVQITKNLADQRIDNFLSSELKGVPKTHIYRILRKGEVRVNKGRVKPQYRLQEGDEVRIPPVAVRAESKVNIPADLQREIRQAIVYESPDLIVVDKPAGLAVHGGSGLKFGLIDVLRSIKGHDIELVHRLDRETSGCLLMTKSKAALRQLHVQLREQTMRKKYFVLVAGNWNTEFKHLRWPLAKRTLSSGERIVYVNENDGKSAHTEVKLMQHFRRCSLLEVEPKTGRTHQIRVHVAEAGNPVLGDQKYYSEQSKQMTKALHLKRLFLHAHHLSFTYKDERVEVAAPLPPELREIINTLESRNR